MSPALRFRWFVFTGVVLLAGCGTRNWERPAMTVPVTWSQPVSTNAPPLDPWWHHFQDTNLTAAIEEALTANHDLRATGARVDAAFELARMAGAAQLPEVGAQLGSTRQQQVFVGFPIPGAAGPLKSRSTTHRLDFVASWELDLWGRVRSGRQAALAEYLSAADAYRAARLSLVARTARAWFGLQETRGQLDLARSTAASYQATFERVNARYEQGLRSPLDVRLARTGAASARALLAAREGEFQTARRQLEILLGRHPAGVVSVEGELAGLADAVPAGLPAGLLERRPDLLAAEWKLAAADFRVDEARAALFPRLSLTVSGGRTSSELEDLLSNNFNVWSLGAGALQPLFQGGRLRANVRLHQARAEEAVENYRQVLLTAFGEVETALAAGQWLARRESELLEADAEARAAQQLAEARYESGLEEFIVLLEAQRRTFEAASQLLAVRRARLENRVALHLALGGGFDSAAGGQGEGTGKP